MSRARSFVLWLHGLGDSGPANEPIKTLFTSPEFRDTKWSFPSAPSAPVTCNYGSVMPSWFDILEIPVTAESPNDDSSLLKAVQNVHATIDREIAAGVNPKNVFICGFSQGGALTLASVLLYPKTLGGGAIFSGWVPFNSSITEQITPEAKQELGDVALSWWEKFVATFHARALFQLLAFMRYLGHRKRYAKIFITIYSLLLLFFRSKSAV